MAQSAKPPTFGFGSGRDLGLVRWSPAQGSTLSMESLKKTQTVHPLKDFEGPAPLKAVPVPGTPARGPTSVPRTTHFGVWA